MTPSSLPNSNFNCPSCGQPLSAPENLFGASIPCPTCSVPVVVPYAFWGEPLEGGQYPQIAGRFLAEFQRLYLSPHDSRIKVRDTLMHRWSPEELEMEIDPETRQPCPGSGIRRGDLTVLYTDEVLIGQFRAMVKSWGVTPLSNKTGDELIDGEVLRAAVNMANATSSEYRRFLNGCDPEVLVMYPAQELLRNEPRIPRGLSTWWQKASEKIDGVGVVSSGSRFIARKDSPIWMALSDFGRPFPPFNLDNALNVQDVDREAAVKLGLIGKAESICNPREKFSINMSGGFFDGGWVLSSPLFESGNE